ncbi:MAG: MgtC/SapB family protein [Edaphobacter sp.]|uniref:MgtC/SapB family protein n=1 Tax=Edaphobacter sp. TaxID=1934404 RepID=UPI0023A0F9E2|nr:MgtC/SapB family protein [Edaphobacter sp.]MDE1177635.1 MgtC/SapB family protein [Edaphobacter sp.]
MPISLTWQQIGLRLVLALVASFLIGFDRDERGQSTGVRTTMLVCLAATLAMLQANMLMNVRGKTPDSFVVLDLMRLPLGILSGIGFIGAGAIIRKDGLVRGLTTAATLWFVTVLGLIFGGGQIWLAVVGSALALFILWILKGIESKFPTHHTGTLALQLNVPDFTPSATSTSPSESELRHQFKAAGFHMRSWTAHYTGFALSAIECELRWPSVMDQEPSTPSFIASIAQEPFVRSLTWHM